MSGGDGVKISLEICQYFRYIRQRLIYANKGILCLCDDEISFYTELYKCIKQYAAQHRIYFKYLLNRYTYADCMRILNFEYERKFFRWVKKTTR